MIFVDTSAWYSMAVPSDQDHALVAQCFSQIFEPFVTTDYVIDETLTLLRARGHNQRALLMGEEFFNGSLAEIKFLSETDVRQTWEVFGKYKDKSWSFTDCSSKMLMEQLQITRAISLDHHFRQFGNITVLP